LKQYIIFQYNTKIINNIIKQITNSNIDFIIVNRQMSSDEIEGALDPAWSQCQNFLDLLKILYYFNFNFTKYKNIISDFFILSFIKSQFIKIVFELFSEDFFLIF